MRQSDPERTLCTGTPELTPGRQAIHARAVEIGSVCLYGGDIRESPHWSAAGAQCLLHDAKFNIVTELPRGVRDIDVAVRLLRHSRSSGGAISSLAARLQPSLRAGLFIIQMAFGSD